ncbi:hypothetical protein [Rhodococcus pyridinivorans]|nr:hypothetical protein [Rhodococcus pyridinivorans]
MTSWESRASFIPSTDRLRNAKASRTMRTAAVTAILAAAAD